MFKKVSDLQQAYLKAGIFGFQGSGKTWTGTELAIGLHRHIKSTKGIVFIDTETGSDFMIPKLKGAGIECYVDKTRAFSDLLKDLSAAGDVADIVIIDSITHFWRELVAAYLKDSRQKFLRIQDWGPLKAEWARYTTLYVNSPLHIVMCGRAANIFEDVAEGDEERGQRKNFKAVKVGTKMAAETETGYEPSLLVEMVKVYLEDGGKYARRASVIKDRFGVIDSKEFDFSPEDKPGHVFKCFKPHVDLLNLGGEHVGFDESRTSKELFGGDGETRAEELRRRKQIALEEIEGLFTRLLPGQDAKTKKMKLDVLQAVFGTTSWKAVTGKTADELEAARATIERLLKLVEANADTLPDPSDFLPWLQSEMSAPAEAARAS